MAPDPRSRAGVDAKRPGETDYHYKVRTGYYRRKGKKLDNAVNSAAGAAAHAATIPVRNAINNGKRVVGAGKAVNDVVKPGGTVDRALVGVGKKAASALKGTVPKNDRYIGNPKGTKTTILGVTVYPNGKKAYEDSKRIPGHGKAKTDARGIVTSPVLGTIKGAGGELLTPKNAKNLPPAPTPKSARERQRMLVQSGYDIDIDGIWGPQSTAAWKNFQQAKKRGIDPKKAGTFWTQHQGASNRNDPAATQAGAGTTTTTRTTAGTTGGGKGAGSGAGSGSGAGTSGAGGTSGGVPTDIMSLAQAMTDMQYGGPIAELSRQITRQGAQSKQNRDDINSGFGDLLKSMMASTKADSAAFDRISGNASDQRTDMLSSLGLDSSVGGQLARTASINDGALQGIEASNEDYDRNMQQAMRMRQEDQVLRQGRTDDAQGADMRAQLLDLITQRGNALSVNTENAKNSEMQRQAQMINQIATLSMLPGQLQGQMLGLDAQSLQNTLTGLGVANARQDLRDPRKHPGQFIPFARLTLKERNDMFGSALGNSGVIGPGKGLMMSPQKAAHFLETAVNQQGYSVKKNPWLATAIRTAVNNALQVSKSKGQWKNATRI